MSTKKAEDVTAVSCKLRVLEMNPRDGRDGSLLRVEIEMNEQAVLALAAMILTQAR